MTVPPTPDAGSTGERRPSPPAGGGEAWSTWSADLVEAVRALAGGESLTVTADTADARPVLLRPARLGGFVPAKHSLVAPWVRLGRSEDFLQGHWWMYTFPGLAIAVSVLGFNLIGDGLQDVLDPRRRS